MIHQICIAVPAGNWTAYDEIAGVTGINPQALGNHLARRPVQQLLRVLRANGTMAPNFRWLAPDPDDDPRDVLAEEGLGSPFREQRVVTVA